MKIKTRYLLKIGILVFGITFLFTNCDTEIIDQNIEDQYAYKQIEVVSQTKDLLSNSKNNLLILKYTKTIDWDNAIVSNGSDGYIVEVPLLLNDKIITLFNGNISLKSFHRLVFIKKSNGYKLYYLQIVTKDKNFDNNRKNFNYYHIQKEFDGYTVLLDSNGEITDFKRYSKGQRIEKSKDKNKDILAKESVYCTYIGWWHEYGSFEPIMLLYCEGGGGGGGDSEYVGHGGGGGGSSSDNSNVDDKIDTDNLDSCSKTILIAIQNDKTIEDIINQFAGENSDFNWTLITTDESNFENPSNSAETSWLNGTTNNYETKIGTNYKNSATKLSIARTIVHEAIHAYILSYIDIAQNGDPQVSYKGFPELWNDMVAKKYGVPNNNLQRYQHEEMARNYVSTISTVLSAWDNNQQNTQYYEDLAWGGLFGTDAFQQSSDLSSLDRTRISNVNNAEDFNLSNSKSNPCE